MGTSTVRPWGALADGRVVEAIRLDDGQGCSATVLTLGATLQAVHVPDARGEPADVVLGHDGPEEYLAHAHYFGCTVGRHANRIAAGRFELDGQVYQLECNDGPNHLHGGGAAAFHRRLWRIEDAQGGRAVLSLQSPAGDGGYPGAVDVTAEFVLGGDGGLELTYGATTDAPTIVNLTNHSYFDLTGGQRGALDGRLQLLASRFVPVGANLIPTGDLPGVGGGPFDFREPRVIAARIRAPDPQLRSARGYDHHFVVDGVAGELRPAARLEDPHSGRTLELLTTAAGVQFYSGNFLDGTIVGKAGRAYRQGDGLCLEAQGYPDAPNQPAFPATRLDPGERYSNRIVLRFGAG